ncbi:hypothetical protein HPB48_005576 [Haemaphysalis longicornis]|uniref:Elongation of very long chain fatty acids protein n=1 Tax=Haemaphysalis longicornis TaxID=44386 RepID=A0A9J6GI66_HAELO|nr:hypothetical protein HPB48_005576 [Haemaphysalis longicornis]
MRLPPRTTFPSRKTLSTSDQPATAGGPSHTGTTLVVMNPLFVFPLVLLYIYFVKVTGPRWMKDRQPYRIDGLVRAYNLLMVLANLKLSSLLLTSMYLPGGSYSLWCQGITGYVDDRLDEVYRTGWVYVILRYADFLDTVFFVLRKKLNQITHLHVIHHVLVALNVWFFVLFAPEGQTAFSLALNSFVHVVMYTYYLLANMGPKVRKYLWWKKYLTTLQIVQFVIISGAHVHTAVCRLRVPPVPHLHGRCTDWPRDGPLPEFLQEVLHRAGEEKGGSQWHCP